MREKKLVLEFPKIEDKADWLKYVEEFHESNPESHPLDFHLGEDFEEWLKKKEDERAGKNLEEGRVSSSVFFLKREGEDRILGHISIRHSIDKEFLAEVGGHIGYGVRPSERGKGYATEMLQLALAECKKLGITNAMITCKKNNLASAKVISNNGGVKRDEINFRGEAFNRYDFKLKQNRQKEMKE